MSKVRHDAPRYPQHCEDCKYLGQYEEYDLYVHPVGNRPTVVAIYNKDGRYLSGLKFARLDCDLALYVAKQLSINSNILKKGFNYES